MLVVFVCAALFGLMACAAQQRPPIHTVDRVNLDRFMGDWYVIASIPTSIEENAYNAVESYELEGSDTVQTTFTFREGGFDGERKTYRPTGYVREGTGNAVWGMEFFWPIKMDYRVIYLDEEYSRTIIGRQKRDYAWIMARSPQIPDAEYQHLVDFLREEGYDTTKLRKVPQQWE
ncbi:lipocalin family protein [Thiohalorhabdus methylotrophus]|uniref:Outer membrane lipoprotein Blc n=1 Tax=Thiohalorhabdus methylotrophus TaxID=3242694 RepID=A0ABV4TUU1_9GAMM